MSRRLLSAAVAVLGLGVGRAADAQDAAAGQRVFNQCRACHIVENNGRSSVGPNLHGVVGRRAGAVPDYRYSPDMRSQAEQGLTWTPESLDRYIENPKAVVPRGSMSFVGLRNAQQRRDVIAYLEALSR